MHSTLDAWLTLVRLPRVGSVAKRKLLAMHGDAPAVLAAIAGGALDALDPSLRNLAKKSDKRLGSDRDWLGGSAQRRLLTIADPDYPALLKRIPDPPLALFVDGAWELLWTAQVAIVGSRNATPGGLALGRSFASHFAAAGLSTCSGLALGMDGAAHQGALDAGGNTVAVLGSGIDRIYPPQHGTLASRIREHGCLVSEYPPGAPPRAENFPQRNRIISGLSLGVLVVEAALGSGSLITARVAAEQGREVFAVPGSVHNPMARGCHELIRKGAKLVETAHEVLAELGPLAQSLGAELRTRLGGLDRAMPPTANELVHRLQPDGPDDEDAALLGAMGHDPVALDQLVERTGSNIPQLSSQLLRLELDGRVASLGGGRYQRLD